MKIGILTFWQTEDNYGQILQCYALQKYLNKIGHEAFLIKYISSAKKRSLKEQILHIIFTISSIAKLKKSLNAKIKYYLNKKQIIDKQRNFDLFRKRNIISTDREYSIYDLENNPPVADCYICGSDQIWSWPNDGFFLNWGDFSIPRFSYATSFGSAEISKEFADKIQPWLLKFNAITVREESGINICKKLGIASVQWVLDPTMLLDSNDYKNLINYDENDDAKGKYILVYILRNKSNIDLKEIEEFANVNNLKIILISNLQKNSSLINHKPSVEGWLKLFINATYIVTNSYHGTIFSIIFKKKFLVYRLKNEYEKMNERIDSLLKQMKLTNRVYDNNIEPIKNEIEYNIVDEIIKEKKIQIKKMFYNWFNNLK